MIGMEDARALGLDPRPLERLAETIEGHIAEGRYPGAEIAVARHGRLALNRRFGRARVDPPRDTAGGTLWLLFSNTKVITAAAVWKLVAEGRLRFTDPVAMHLPGFEAHGKGQQSVLELLTHQGGFPNSDMPPEAWEDREARRRAVIGFEVEWTPRKPCPLPRRSRALGGCGADRGGFRPGLPRLHSRRGHHAARAGE